MPYDAVTERTTVEERPGSHDIVVLKKYEAPADVRFTEDQYKDADAAIADYIYAVLRRHHPGHLWAVIADSKHGIMRWSLPILMGVDWWYILNCRTHDLTQRNILLGAGEILERYRLSRTTFNVGEFLDAREKHSRLVLPSRLIPG